MANQIDKFKVYVDQLDDVYKMASKTAVLDGAPELVKQGANANELIIPMIDMDGLADYDAGSGYKAGDVTFKNETVKCNFDRGRKFSVDALDDIDTAGMAFGKLAAEFERTKVVPEQDAFRLASYCGKEGADITSGNITDGATAIKAIASKYDAMTDKEVPEDMRYLFVTTTIAGYIRDMDTTKSRELLNKFAGVIEVPTSRFYTQIELVAEGGFKKAAGGKALDFLIIHKPAVIQYPKRIVNKAIPPEDNKDADAWQFNFREVGIADAYKNKTAGIAGQYHE